MLPVTVPRIVTGSPIAGDPDETDALTKCFVAMVAVAPMVPGTVLFAADDDVVGSGKTIPDEGRTASAARTASAMTAVLKKDRDFFILEF